MTDKLLVSDGGVLKSLYDKKTYRAYTLPNGIKVLLVSKPLTVDYSEKNDEENTEDSEDGEEIDDSSCHMAGISVSVGVGSSDDPENIPGLSHFLEHMLFMGSEKYPEEDQFDEFVKSQGGANNAYTAPEATVYYLKLKTSGLKEGLDRIAQFFISPLFCPSSIGREMKAVDNEFNISRSVERDRIELLVQSTLKSSSKLSKFACGNLVSLKDALVEKGIDIRQELIKHYKKYYKANKICLSVVAALPLDEMVSIVEEKFTQIPACSDSMIDRNVPENVQEIVNEGRFNKLYKVVPLSDTHSLFLNWLIPTQKSQYELASAQIISHLLGHESIGSVCDYLRKKQWATEFLVGYEPSNESRKCSYAMFLSIEIKLTALGMDHVPEIISAIFQYFRLILTCKEHEKYYHELYQLLLTNFLFDEDHEPHEDAARLAESMQHYPIEHWVTANDILYQFHQDNIEKFGELFTSKNLTILWLSMNFSQSCDSTERWTGLKYSMSEIPQSWIQAFISPPTISEFHLPLPNKFIPSSLKVLENSQPKTEYPSVIMKSEKCVLWYKCSSDVFYQPKSSIRIQIFSDIAFDDEQIVLLKIWLQAVELSLVAQLYDANLVGYSSKFSRKIRSIQVNISGLTDKLKVYVDQLMEGMKSVEITEKLFKFAFESSQNEFKEFIRDQRKLASSFCHSLLHGLSNTPFGEANYSSSVTIDQLRQFHLDFFNKIHLKMLIQGDLDAVHAKSIADSCCDILFRNSSIMNPGSIPKCEEFAIPPGKSLFKHPSLDVTDKNMSVFNIYDIGSMDFEMYAQLFMLVFLMEVPVFYSLRTKQQLGYSVGVKFYEECGIGYLSMIVISDIQKFTLEHVDACIETFLEEFLQNLKDLTDEDLESSREGAIHELMEEPTNLEDAVKRNWQEILIDRNMFDIRKKLAQSLQNVTKNKLVEVYQQFLLRRGSCSHQTYPKFSVQFYGLGEEDRSELMNLKNVFTPKIDSNEHYDYVVGDLKTLKDLLKPHKVNFSW